MTAVFATLALAGLIASAPGGDPSALYKVNCASCHDSTEGRAPDRRAMKARTPAAILASLTTGTMAVHARGLSVVEKRALAEFLGTAAADGPVTREAALCDPGEFRDSDTGPRWSGWGVDLENTRYQRDPGLAAADVPRLKLKWAFGLPGVTSAWGQPAVVGGRVFVGSATGVVYSLDAKTGCAHWSYTAPAGVRTAINVGRIAGSGGARSAIFFGDVRGHVHALDASTGALLWSTQVEQHEAARITGAPALHGNRLYVPVSSSEEVSAGRPGYRCCTFRGSVVALDTATGRVIWRAFTIQQPARPVRDKSDGTTLLGPAGAAIWMAPTLDIERRAIYVGTGNAYSEPDTGTGDAIIAIDMDTGRIRWTRQITPGDVFVSNCRGEKRTNPNCADDVGPDFDFGSSPILARREAARSVLIVGQKSGVVYGLDPDKDGALLWQFRVGKGGQLGGIQWGMAADEEHVYVPVSDRHEPADSPRGLFALRTGTGAMVWHNKTRAPECGTDRACTGALSAAATAIPGVVFAGSVDGHLRAYSTRDGQALWSFDTAREFETVNGVRASGGTIDSAGPVVVDGMVFTGSGYGNWKSQPGNVLLAFEVERR